MGMAVKIGSMTLCTSGTNTSGSTEDVGCMRPATGRIIRVYQGWRCGMAIGAPCFVNDHGIGRRMADSHAGRRVPDNVQSNVIGRKMGRWCTFGPMAVEAFDGDEGVDDVLHRSTYCSIGVVDIPVFIVADRAVIKMGGQDICPTLNRMAIGTGPGINLAQVSRVECHSMFNAASGAMVVTAKVGLVAVDTLTISAFTAQTVTG